MFSRSTILFLFCNFRNFRYLCTSNQKEYPSRASFSPDQAAASPRPSRSTQSQAPHHTGNEKHTPARMAESVDALVSNTSGAIRAGSIPAPGTRKWPTDTCRPFLYPIFPTFSPHLTIILQKVFRFFRNFSTAHITPGLRRIICLASSIRRV